MPGGKLIVIEGNDCSGKQTQAKMLVERLNSLGIKSEGISFPRYNTPTGNIVGICYLGKPPSEMFNPDFDISNISDLGSWFGDANSVDPKIASLYYAADRAFAASGIRRKLEEGIILICDRYVGSNMGHQCGKLKEKEDRIKMASWLWCLEYSLFNLPVPDETIFLRMPYQVAQELNKNRCGKPDGHESNPEHLKNAERAYLELINRYNWKVVHCTLNNDMGSLKTRAKIHEEVCGYVKDVL